MNSINEKGNDDVLPGSQLIVDSGQKNNKRNQKMLAKRKG